MTKGARAWPASTETWIVGGLIVLAALLRFATLTHQSYWYDEAVTVHELQSSFGTMLSAVAKVESSPPLYYLVGWLWAKVFGTGELGLRTLSALAGTAVAPLVYLTARDLASRRAGVIAGVLAAVNPFMIWYSQEARCYMLLAALSAASLYWFVRSLQARSRRALAWWGIFSSLALLTHFFAGFLVFGEAAWLLVRARSRVVLAIVAGLVALQAALVPLATNDTAHGLGWIGRIPLSIRIEQVPTEFALGTLYRSSLVTHGLLGAGVLAGFVFVLVMLGGTARERAAAAITAALAAVVLLVPLALAELGQDYFFARNLMPAWIPLCVLVAVACSAPLARTAGYCLAAALALSFAWALVRIDQRPVFQRPDWRGVARSLGGTAHPRAIVVLDGTLAAGPLAIYVPRVAWPQPPPRPRSVGEIALVGANPQEGARLLPPGAKLITTKHIDGTTIERFSMARPEPVRPSAISVAERGAVVLFQRPRAGA